MNDATNSHESLQAEIHNLAVAIKAALLERGEMMATAESCTGGLVASSIVNEAGSSAILKGGIVAYQNEVKTKLLGVPESILLEHGAVSAETVIDRDRVFTPIYRNANVAVEQEPEE